MQLPSKFQIGEMVRYSTMAASQGADAVNEFRVAAVLFDETGVRYRLQRKAPDQRTGPADRRQRDLGAGYHDLGSAFGGSRTTPEEDLSKIDDAAPDAPA